MSIPNPAQVAALIHKQVPSEAPKPKRKARSRAKREAVLTQEQTTAREWANATAIGHTLDPDAAAALRDLARGDEGSTR